jgi:hypothetical protein
MQNILILGGEVKFMSDDVDSSGQQTRFPCWDGVWLYTLYHGTGSEFEENT